MLGQPASWHTVCRPASATSCRRCVYSGPIRARVLIQGGFRSIAVSALRASSRSRRRPLGASRRSRRRGDAHDLKASCRDDRAVVTSGSRRVGKCRSMTGNTSATETFRASSAEIDVTPASLIPHGTIRSNQLRSASQFRAKPCSVTRRETRIPIAATLRWGRSASAVQPYPGPSRYPHRRQAELGADVDQQLLHPADIGDDVEWAGSFTIG